MSLAPSRDSARCLYWGLALTDEEDNDDTLFELVDAAIVVAAVALLLLEILLLPLLQMLSLLSVASTGARLTAVEGSWHRGKAAF